MTHVKHIVDTMVTSETTIKVVLLFIVYVSSLPDAHTVSTSLLALTDINGTCPSGMVRPTKSQCESIGGGGNETFMYVDGDAFNHTHSSLPFGCVLSLDRESTSDPNKKGITWNDEFGIKALFNRTLNAAGGPTLKDVSVETLIEAARSRPCGTECVCIRCPSCADLKVTYKGGEVTARILRF